MAAGDRPLERVVGTGGAVLLGLGSILGTGIFVSIGLAAEIAGASMLAAMVLAAAVATCNGLASAELAANHPVSGGTYEYGHRYLSPLLGFVAGWMFVCAKTASAATAALGLAAHAPALVGGSLGEAGRIGLALAAVAALTVAIAGGMRRSNRLNAVIVSITLIALAAFVIAGLGTGDLFASGGAEHSSSGGPIEICRAAAIFFVAYTGYGRIATLGEEVHDPARTIPRAMIVTLVTTLAIYVAVGAVALAALGSDGLGRALHESSTPLEAAARALGVPATVERLLAVAAVTAMAGVLVNLILGVSRVVLAMARRGELPRALAAVDASSSSPRQAVFATGLVIALLTAFGEIATAWTFSALTVLVYYAITNLAALRLSAAERHVSPLVPALGLAGCLGLAIWIEPWAWAAGAALVAAGLPLHFRSRRADRNGQAT